MKATDFAKTHAAAFGKGSWPTRDFVRYMADSRTLIFGDAMCFAVFRIVGPEAEVLTLATHPDVQGTGRATALLRDALPRLRAAHVDDVFLEVAADNTAARALYTRLGFAQFATRDNYYANGAAAICMKSVLSAASPR